MTQLTLKPATTDCACCGKIRPCHMYGLQDGTAAFVCDECRNPKPAKGDPGTEPGCVGAAADNSSPR